MSRLWTEMPRPGSGGDDFDLEGKNLLRDYMAELELKQQAEALNSDTSPRAWERKQAAISRGRAGEESPLSKAIAKLDQKQTIESLYSDMLPRASERRRAVISRGRLPDTTRLRELWAQNPQGLSFEEFLQKARKTSDSPLGTLG